MTKPWEETWTGENDGTYPFEVRISGTSITNPVLQGFREAADVKLAAQAPAMVRLLMRECVDHPKTAREHEVREVLTAAGVLPWD